MALSAKRKPVRDVRRKILEMARDHLRRFGERKMTIVEIARSLGMSHANIYRFFSGKSEIVDALMDDWLAKVESLLAPIIERPVSAAERIEAVILELHRKRREKLRTDGRFYEAFRSLISTRPDAIKKRDWKIFDVFRKLIADGVRAGEFPPLDCDEAAGALEDATGIFLHPLTIPAILNELTESRVRRVVRYLLAGFGRAGAQPPQKKISRRVSVRARR